MGKLRLVQERSEQRSQSADHPQDLRGLGNDPVIRQSFPYANLTLSGSLGLNELKHLCSHFKLVSKQSSLNKCLHHITTPNPQPGNHKLDTIKLFGVALAVKNTHGDNSILLTQISQLHYQMALAIGRPGVANKYTADSVAKSWLQHKKDFSIDTSIQLTLTQAGLPITSSTSDFTHLTNADFSRCMAHFEKQNSAETQNSSQVLKMKVA